MKQENGKLIPEVGDIWQNARGIHFVLRVRSDEDEVFTLGIRDKSDLSAIYAYYYYISPFCEHSTYLGKAKHPLSTIFEVKL